jgi:EmrB/QacA subfamily drug resistance transporter
MSSDAISPLSYTTMSTRSDTTPASSSGHTGGGTSLPARGVLMWALVTAPAMHLDATWCVARRAREVVPEGGVRTHRHNPWPERGGVAADQHLVPLLVDIAMEWTVNAYNLSFAVLLMTGTALGDRFGRRRVFVAGLGLFVAASAACALAAGVGWLIAARAVQGAAAALAMALLDAAFPPAQRARALGIFSGVTGLAVLGGPVIGGAIAQGIAWQWIFWLNVPIGLLVIPLVLTRIPESSGADGALDGGGLALVTGAAVGLVWGQVRGNNAGWASPEVTTALAAGALLGVAFVAWELRLELRARQPMVPMRLFGSRAFSQGNAVSFLLYAALYAALFFMAQFLQTAQGHRPLGAGLRLLPWTATLLVGRAGRRRAGQPGVGERPLVAGGLLLQAAGMAWIGLLATPGLADSKLVAPLIVAGAGVSMAMPAAQHAVVGSVASAALGKASGTFNLLRFLGGVFGVAILVAVFASAGSYGSGQAFSHGFAPAIGVAAALSLVGAAVGMGLPGRRQATQPACAPHRRGPAGGGQRRGAKGAY